MIEQINKLIGHKRYTPATASEIHSNLGLPSGRLKELRRTLQELETLGRIARIEGDRYLDVVSAGIVAGRIQITKSGRGFVMPEDPTMKEIAIRANDTGTALHDDQVLVKRTLSSKGADRNVGEKAETGKVIRVIERRRTRFVGTLRKDGKSLLVTPDDPRFPREIAVNFPNQNGRPPRAGEKVVVELERWDSRHATPRGTLLEVLGAASAEGVDMLSVLRQYDLCSEFPDDVLAEARRFGDRVTEKDFVGRRDCRDDLVVTIDPDDAKDFDDAFSLEKVGRNRWKLKVHIADVSHYVRPGSALDREAKVRGNSSYLVDRVVPMLPEELSNELCSLKPRVDRLSKCVEFLITGDGKVGRTDFYPAVIHSRKRLAYADAMAALSSPPNDEIGKMLHEANHLAQTIRKRRFKAGSLDLDFPETKIRLDTRGDIDRIDLHENDLSHQLIEEFMLLANEAVAGRLMKLKSPTIYRVHEAPDPDRLEDYRSEVLNHEVPCGNLTKTAEVQKLFRRLGDLAIGSALKIGFLRSLNRARYTSEPLGHYGLAKKKYAHFTSPIRRYADLVVHRSLFPEKHSKGGPGLDGVADHLSSTERNSADAERDSKDVKLHAFLLKQIKSGKPEHYKAMVTGLRDFGFFVDVGALGMSGMVPLSLLKDDYYELAADGKGIRARRFGRTIRVGDEITVQIAKVDPAKKIVDFQLAGEVASPKASRKPSRRRNRSKDNKSPKQEAGGKAETGSASPGGKSSTSRSRRRSRNRRSSGNSSGNSVQSGSA